MLLLKIFSYSVNAIMWVQTNSIGTSTLIKIKKEKLEIYSEK